MLPETFDDAAGHDRITGLARLPLALAEIEALAREQPAGRLLGVIAVAIPPTPTRYRLSGDVIRALRQEISQQFGVVLRPKDRVYSIGRWEWLAVLPELVSSAPLMLAGMKLCETFDRLLGATQNALTLHAACGAALWPDHGEDSRHLVQSARIARLRAEQEARSPQLYSEDMEQIDPEQQYRLGALRRALKGDGSIALHLQPQVDLASGRCVGAEALLRWCPDNGSPVPPPLVLALVERFGLRNAFNRWLLLQGMQLLAGLAEAGIDIPVSLNFSADNLLNPELPDLIGQALATWEIAPARLVIEITETTMLERTEAVLAVLARLRTLGVQLSIDDFGTGYSGMGHLQQLPAHEVKIDQSFVRNALESARDREIIASIIQLAHRLGIMVLAEGIASHETGAVLQSLGCDRGQGFLFAPALPLPEFVAWWRDRHQA